MRNDDGRFRPIVRIGPNEVSIMATEGIKVVFDGGFERSPWYSVFSNFGWVKLHIPDIRTHPTEWHE